MGMADMREKLIDIVEWYADFLDWERKEDIVDSIMKLFATDNNVGGKWIPVTERLPKGANGKSLCESVIAYLNCKGVSPQICVGWLNGTWWYLLADDDDYYTTWKFEDVTHWMPLPEPPKEEAKQDCTYNKNGHCMGQKMMPECDPKSCDRKNQ